jgi:hypothetical protein
MIDMSPTRVSFARHETFPLRYGWLTKGYQAWCERAGVFTDEDATVTLGVGKNMVSAIQFWLCATQIFRAERGTGPTELGRAIFSASGWDPYLEDDTTIWLIHWLIASNPREATSIFWFFNRFHKPDFAPKDVLEGLHEYCRENISSRFALSTLKRDVTLLLRMYQSTPATPDVFQEDGLDSPVSTLGLLRQIEGGRYQSLPEFRWRLPIASFAFAVSEVFEHCKLPALPIERLMHSDGSIAAPGAVFRLTEECMLRKLEELIMWVPHTFELRETSGIHQLYQVRDLSPVEVLRRHYE